MITFNHSSKSSLIDR